ncbi:MAG: PSD1 and planctomycete cytochrome C domain-containing protein [Bryobacteraceae bacterium]|nr:PSD1 and planctomycete cytochrome C domain-containing protein [Bryobacteraceae bacterium]
MRLLCVFFLAGCALLAEVSFNRDIRPILSDTCFRCHGPDQSSRMAALRLDRREDALRPRRSGTPIVPGDAQASLIVQRIFAEGARLMPPESAHKTLSAAQKNLLRQWVAEGAKYEGHWAYQSLPKPAGTIDAFIDRGLRRAALPAAPPADRRTLIRRLSLDLTGLPPSPADVADFERSGQYEALVDRLLASPGFAEKQTMLWLDAVRYADTCGFHGDNAFPAWPYRDYVLRSFQQNKPFDQFTREQIAGDLLPNATREQRTATALHRLTRTSAEGGIQPKEYLAKYAADRVRTVSAVWLGSTLGCAECHNHKFDPFLAKDFYAMKAFFADIQETGLVPDRGKDAWGKQLLLPTPAQEAQLAAIEKTIASLPAGPVAEKATTFGWVVQKPQRSSATNGVELKPGKGDTLTAEGPNPDHATYEVTLTPGEGQWTHLGLEVQGDDRLPGANLARGADRLVITEVEALADGRPVAFTVAATNTVFSTKDLPAGAAIDQQAGSGWGVNTYGDPRNAVLSLRFAQPLAAKELVVRLRHDSAWRRATTGRFRLALSQEAVAWPVGFEAKTPTVSKELLERDAAFANGDVALFRAQLERDLLKSAMAKVVVTESGKPEVTRILPRGNWMDESGAIVEPAIPEFLGRLSTPGRATRLDLANWIVSRENPLTARVFANRIWRQFFGTGLSKVLDDLGSQGEWPTHPELLDYLAAEFASDWNVKRLIKLVVMSETYQRASQPTPLMLERDPENRLYARQSRYRVEAEVVRDIALSAAGLLQNEFGGPSIRPPQPDGYLAALNYPIRDYSATEGQAQYRRGLYVHWQRTFLHPSLMTFDAPSREECTVNRTSSNTPLQALVLLNDPIFVEAARGLAQRMAGAPTFEARVNLAFERALGRPVTAEEAAVLRELYQKSKAQLTQASAKQLLGVGESPAAGDDVDLAALTTVARAVLNLHGTVTRN